jgi:hypothetical protein
MFVVNEDNSIYANRGDVVCIGVEAKDNKTDAPKKFQPGDVLRFTIYGKKEAGSVLMQKDFPISEVCETATIFLDSKDMTFGDVISKHKDYWYDIRLNPDTEQQTIVGYFEDGAVLFRLFPESVDIETYFPEPEDLPVVDDELDGSSPRPISNSAVTREIIKILDDCERTRDAVTELYVTPQMFGAIGDGKADDTEAIQYCLDNYKDVVLPAGTYIISKSLVMKKKGQTLKGMSSDAVIKAANGFSGDMLVMDGTATSAYRSNQQLSSVGIVGNGLCNGLRFKMNADFFVRNVIVSGCEWGIVSGDSLLYHVFGTMVCECTNGVKFENSANLSAANNVCFDMCQIISIAKYAIYSESGDSTHNAVFQCCEIEATNTDKEDISPITLQSKSSSGSSPIMVFRNCWLEQNHGKIPVLITGTDGYLKQYIFDGCTIMNTANACDYFISATGRTLVMLNQSDPCTYNAASIKMANGRLFILGGLFSYDVDDEEKVTHLGYDGYVNSSMVFRNSYGTQYKSLGGKDHNKIFAQSNKLKIVADTDLVYLEGAKGVELSNSFVKPLKLGSMYLWAYNEKLYAKYGGAPTAYNDGTVFVDLA